jgi:hypothetical protein
MGRTRDTVGSSLGTTWALFGHLPDNKVFAHSPAGAHLVRGHLPTYSSHEHDAKPTANGGP